MGTKPAKHTRAGKPRAAETTKRVARVFQTAEALHLKLVGIHAAAVVAAEAVSRPVQIHLQRHVVMPLDEIIEGWEKGRLSGVLK